MKMSDLWEQEIKKFAILDGRRFKSRCYIGLTISINFASIQDWLLNLRVIQR